MSANAVIETKQRIFDMVERFPTWQLNNLAQSLEGMLKMTDEEADDLAFCESLYERAMADPENAEEGICIEEYAAKWGIDLGAYDED